MPPGIKEEVGNEIESKLRAPSGGINDYLDPSRGEASGKVGPAELEAAKREARISELRLRERPLAFAAISNLATRDSVGLIEDPIIQTLMTVAAAFQSFEAGRAWLLTPNPSFGHAPPLSSVTTEAGRELVANELGLIEHGMV